MTEPLPLVDLAGPPEQQGHDHGAALADQIQHNIALYRQRFRDQLGLTQGELHDALNDWGTLLRVEQPTYWIALRAMADAADARLSDIVALNVRYEIMHRPEVLQPEGCSSVLVPASADHGTWLAQNWDYIADVESAVVRTRHPKALTTLTVNEAGILGGKLGCNSAGIGLCINALDSDEDAWRGPGLPFHVRTAAMLRCRTVADARSIAVRPPRATAANFLLAGAAGALDIEVRPDACYEWPAADTFVHTNHFFGDEAAGTVPEDNLRSVRRRHELLGLLAADERTRSDPAEALRTHLSSAVGRPYGICRLPSDDEIAAGEAYQTNVSIVMDLSRGVMWATNGPPAFAPFTEYRIEDTA